jgi:tetratricopeptide (TPR) repeat protein
LVNEGQTDDGAAGSLNALKKRLSDEKRAQRKTESWLAKATQLSRGAVRNTLGGPSMPQRETVQRVGRALGLKADKLLKLLEQAEAEARTQKASSKTWWRVGRGREVANDGVQAQVRDENREVSYFLTQGMPKRRVFSTREARERPVLLLRAEHQQIDFVGRGSVLGSLREWRDSDGDASASVSVRLLHGPAGQGKSRLAIEFGAISWADGWTVLHVRCAADGTTVDLDNRSTQERAEPGRPDVLLLIVDYAERWPHQQLIGFLNDCRGQEGRYVRVLLISRSAGGWWSTPTRYLTNWGVPFDDIRLRPLEEDGGVDRGTLYARACAYFASAVGAAEPAKPRDLTAEKFSTVLAVHMAALVDTEVERRGEELSASRVAISEYLVKREREHWERLLESRRVAIGPDAFAQVVYAATLTGALPRAEALDALARIKVECRETTTMVLKDHTVAYPAHQFDTALEPLQPDLLGEDFLALLLPTEPVLSLLGDGWSEAAPFRLILGEASADDTEDGGPPASWTKRALIMLIEAAGRWEHVTLRQVVPLLEARPELIRLAGSAAISRLAHNRWVPEHLLDVLESKLPFKDVELDAGAASLAERLTAYRLRMAGNATYARAGVHRRLAHRLENIQEYAKATAEIEKALELRRRLKDKDDGSRAEWAFDLDWAGIMFSMNGDHARALEATSGAADIYAELVACYRKVNPAVADEMRRRLTYTLANLANRQLSAEVRRDHAREGVRLSYLLIGEGDPTQDHIELAGALQNLGNALRDLGQLDEALGHLRRAVEIRRVQTRRQFGFYAPLLASAYVGLRTCQVRMGSLSEALTVAEEEVELLRTMAEANQALYSDQLAEAERIRQELTRLAG